MLTADRWIRDLPQQFQEKENIEIVLTGVQLKKKCIDFRAMSDKILTRKNKRTDFQEGT